MASVQKSSSKLVHLFGILRVDASGEERTLFLPVMAVTITITLGGIDKFIPRITLCHQEVSRVMANGDPEEQTFLSHPYTINGFFFLLTIKFRIFILTLKRQSQLQQRTNFAASFLIFEKNKV